MTELVIGGSASGKSEYAEHRLMERCREGRVYLATMHVSDGESARRVDIHRKRRQDWQFATVECPTGLEEAQIPEGSGVLLECLSNLAANELFSGESMQDPEETFQRIVRGLERLRERAAELVVVSNDIFADGEIWTDGMAAYCDLLARLNAWLAERSDRVTEVVCGIPCPARQAAAGASEADADRPHGKDEEHSMILITGGSRQGQNEYALSLWKENRAPRIYEAPGEIPESWSGVDILLDFHMLAQKLLAEGRDVREEAEKILKEAPGLILTTDEIGCGPVPMDAAARLWREETGRAVCRLAAGATEVFRMVCGVPQRLMP